MYVIFSIFSSLINVMSPSCFTIVYSWLVIRIGTAWMLAFTTTNNDVALTTWVDFKFGSPHSIHVWCAIVTYSQQVDTLEIETLSSNKTKPGQGKKLWPLFTLQHFQYLIVDFTSMNEEGTVLCKWATETSERLRDICKVRPNLCAMFIVSGRWNLQLPIGVNPRTQHQEQHPHCHGC